MKVDGDPPSNLTRRVTLIALALVAFWWCLMFALTCLAAWVQASVGWEPPTLSKFAAPALALIAAGGTMLWLRRDRASSAPVAMAATLLVLTIPLSLTMYVRVMFSILFAAMSVDPGG